MNSSQLRTAFKTRKTVQRVAFSKDTKQRVGRLAHEYFRSSPHYEPGNFAVAEGYDIQDTSFMTNKHFNIEQLTVYIGSPEEVDWVSRDYEVPPRNEGIAQLHPRKGEIMALLELAYQEDDEAFDSELDGADWLLLAEEGGSLTEAAFFSSWDAEDFEHFSDEETHDGHDPGADNFEVSTDDSKVD